MAWSYKKRTVEYIIYLLFWSVLLLSPLFGAFIKSAFYNDNTFMPTVDELVAFWRFLLPAIILFFINNNILMPFLLYKKRGRHFVLYLLCVVVVSAIVFMAFPVDEPGFLHIQGLPAGEMPSLPFDAASDAELPPPPFDATPDAEQLPRPPFFEEQGVWMFFSHPKNVRILLMLFVLVFNVCVRLFFFTIRRDESIKELEKEKLRSELEYLKYQINPHFFMNSLNNIHALIDIDKEKAQAAVQDLSGMMRYVLYERSSMFVPLEKEIQFLQNFIELMRLRYTGKLQVDTCFTPEPQGVFVPSLLLMQFVENAFKHGVTYTKKSYINVSLTIDDAGENVVFMCRNTLPVVAVKESATGGIGIENTRKRLELLYGGRACLQIGEKDGWYNVELKIPIEYDKVYNS